MALFLIYNIYSTK